MRSGLKAWRSSFNCLCLMTKLLASILNISNLCFHNFGIAAVDDLLRSNARKRWNKLQPAGWTVGPWRPQRTQQDRVCIQCCREHVDVIRGFWFGSFIDAVSSRSCSSTAADLWSFKTLRAWLLQFASKTRSFRPSPTHMMHIFIDPLWQTLCEDTVIDRSCLRILMFSSFLQNQSKPAIEVRTAVGR